jgi:hypothetical protein
MLPEMQQGSHPDKQCLSAVLKKVLSHDIIRMTKCAAAFIENAAVGCYDRLVNNLVLMLLAKLGLPTTVTACLVTLWDSAIHCEYSLDPLGCDPVLGEKREKQW